jgi:hypothetical protein
VDGPHRVNAPGGPRTVCSVNLTVAEIRFAFMTFSSPKNTLLLEVQVDGSKGVSRLPCDIVLSSTSRYKYANHF